MVLGQSNGTGGDLRISVTRVLATEAVFNACFPNCSRPQYAMAGFSRGVEYENASLTLSSAASVTLNGTTAPALGLVSESLTLSGNLTTRLTWIDNSSSAGPREEWFNASSAANSSGQFAFATPLGLLPDPFGAGSVWSGARTMTGTSTTAFRGALEYQGNLIPSNHSGFAGTSSPISPADVSVQGQDNGGALPAPLAGDRAVGLSPSGASVNLLEGDVLVPSSAYLFAGFDSGCDLAQRPCSANASTPELDVNRSDSAHLGWEAAATSVAPFALRFDERAVYDVPNGVPFWPAVAQLPPGPHPSGGSTLAPTVSGLPESVVSAEAVQAAWRTTANSTSGGGHRGPGLRPIPTLPEHALRGPGALWLGPGVGPSVAGGFPTVPVAIAVLAVSASTIAGAAVIRRRKLKAAENAEPPPSEETTKEPPSDDDPMGYVW